MFLGLSWTGGGKCEDEARRSGAVKSMSTNRVAHCGRRMAASHAFASADAHRAHAGRRQVSVIAVAPRGRAVASRHAFASTEAARAQDRCQVSSLAVAAAPLALAAIHAKDSADAARVQVGFCHVSFMVFMFDSMLVQSACDNKDLFW